MILHLIFFLFQQLKNINGKPILACNHTTRGCGTDLDTMIPVNRQTFPSFLKEAQYFHSAKPFILFFFLACSILMYDLCCVIQ